MSDFNQGRFAKVWAQTRLHISNDLIRQTGGYEGAQGMQRRAVGMFGMNGSIHNVQRASSDRGGFFSIILINCV